MFGKRVEEIYPEIVIHTSQPTVGRTAAPVVVRHIQLKATILTMRDTIQATPIVDVVFAGNNQHWKLLLT